MVRIPPRIAASPCFVPLGPDLGETCISWDTGDGSHGQVFLAVNDQPEVIFAEGYRGSKPAPWIAANTTYDFHLYSGTDRKRLLAAVTVKRGNPPVITATPNPVPARKSPGTTRVTWDTGDGSRAAVYLKEPGKDEVLFAQGSKHTVEVPWIMPGGTYQFRLYSSPEREKLLSSVTVKFGGAPSILATPNPVPVPASGDPGCAEISWDTGDGSLGSVYLVEPNQPETLFASGPKGTSGASWITPGHRYEFRLYQGEEKEILLGSVKVTGQHR